MTAFYVSFPLLLAAALALYGVQRHRSGNSEEFRGRVRRLLRASAVAFCVISLVSIFLPDAFLISYSADSLTERSTKEICFALVRWIGSLGFIMIPLAVFLDNRAVRNVALCFCSVAALISVACAPIFLEYYTSELGKGLNSISVIGEDFKAFMINPTFRGTVLALTRALELGTIIILALNERHVPDFRKKSELGEFLALLASSLLCCVPIYVPQHLFGYTDIIFDAWTLPHIIWLLATLSLIVLLYNIFKSRPRETQKTLCLVLSLSLLMQYMQMFGAISINLRRLPLQLCNIAAFLLLAALVSENEHIINFTMVVNTVGVLLALAVPDLDGKGLFYLYNMHYVFEHTNVLVIPVLAMLFGIFPRPGKRTLRDALVGFSGYFVTVLTLGTAFNALASVTGDSFFKANYLFMFDSEVASGLIPIMSTLFATQINIGEHVVLYPIIQIIVYVVFTALCVLMYHILRLIYTASDKFKKKA